MTKHVKHEDSHDVQLRTKFRDEYGNEMEGVIEYDPVSGSGKRIKDPKLGIVEGFFRKGGSIEIDGHNFDDTNQDEDEIDAIREVNNMNVNRSSNPELYADMVRSKRDKKREDKVNPPKDKNVVALEKANKAKDGNVSPPVFTAKNNIKKGNRVVVDWDNGEIDTAPEDAPDNVLHADEVAREQAGHKAQPHGKNVP